MGKKRFSGGWRISLPCGAARAGGISTVTVQFREFGVRLRFTPIIQPNGAIHLHVMPEVSTRTSRTRSRFRGLRFRQSARARRIRNLSCRMTELRDCGADGYRVTNVSNKFPFLGDIPIIGTFFKSKSDQKSNSVIDGAVHGAEDCGSSKAQRPLRGRSHI